MQISLSYVVPIDSPDYGVSSPPITKNTSNKSIQESKQVIPSAGEEGEEKVTEGLQLLFPALQSSSGFCSMNVQNFDEFPVSKIDFMK